MRRGAAMNRREELGQDDDTRTLAANFCLFDLGIVRHDVLCKNGVYGLLGAEH
jgi:hypothetical protein